MNRASTNKYQVFYGAIPTPDFDDAHIASIIEIDTIRDDSFPEGEYEYLAIGEWFVKSPFYVVSAGMHSAIAKDSKWANELASNEKIILDEVENGNFIMEVQKFMASEFGKPVPKGADHLYKISAAYGDSLFDFGFQAIMFPSVQMKGKSFNVAIKSDLVDNKSIDINIAAVIRGSKIKREIFWGWYLECSHFSEDDIRWVEPHPSAQISGNDLERFKKITDQNGSFPVKPKIIIT